MNRIAVITGATSGMGQEFVRYMIRYMPMVDEFWLIARSEDKLTAIADRYPTKGFRIFPMDLEDPESWEKYKNELEMERPVIAALVNAAGYGIVGNISEIDVTTQTGMIRLNCEALEAMTQLSLPYMRQGTKLIQLGSASAFLPQPQFGVYAASKAFVLSYSRALRRELSGTGIHVTCVCPGPVDTPFFDRAEAIHKSSMLKKAFRADPQKVVKKAMIDARRNKAVSVYGIPMKLVQIFGKILPVGLILKIVY